MQKDDTIVNEIIDFFIRTWAWFFYVFIGLIGKFGLYFKGERKDTGWQILGSTCIAGFVGYLATIYCMEHYPPPVGGYSKEGALIVPMATLLSDRVMMFIMGINWNVFIETIIEKTQKKKNK